MADERKLIEDQLGDLGQRIADHDHAIEDLKSRTGEFAKAWMQRLDRKFNTLADRFDQLEVRMSRLESDNIGAKRDVSDVHQLSYRLDKRLERLETRFETVEPSDG